MKYKKLLYDELIGHRDNLASINSWFAVKDYVYKWDMYDACSNRAVKPKHRHRRSMRYADMMILLGDRDDYRFAHEAKPIGRRKRGKWLYMPKRVRLE